MEIEKACSLFCYAAGTVFLILALCGAWRHFFTMSICFTTGLMIAEDKHPSK